MRSFDYLASRPEGGKLLTSYGWGGYAIFRLWPKYKVYIDGRADMYGGAMVNSVKELEALSPGWKRELRKANPDVIVWPARLPLAQALDLAPGWRRVALPAKDKVGSVFVPAGAPTAAVSPDRHKAHAEDTDAELAVAKTDR